MSRGDLLRNLFAHAAPLASDASRAISIYFSVYASYILIMQYLITRSLQINCNCVIIPKIIYYKSLISNYIENV